MPCLFEEAYGLHRDKIFSFFRYRTDTVMDAEDLTATVFLRMWEKGVVDLPWLYTVARNLLTDYYRGAKPVLVPQFYSEGERPNFDERQRFHSIAKAFLRLTAVQQQVVELRLLDHSYRDIGVILDRRAGSTKAVWHRATKRLQQILGGGSRDAVVPRDS